MIFPFHPHHLLPKFPLTSAARAMALEAHKDQKYGELPYDYHLKAVVKALEDVDFEEYDVLAAAAWLHDAVEDTSLTLHDIRQRCGGRVARLVDAVTDGPGETRQERKAAMYVKLQAAPWEARRLKLADRIANTEASIEDPKRSRMYASEFPEFIRRVGGDHQNQDLALRLFWLYLDSPSVRDLPARVNRLEEAARASARVMWMAENYAEAGGRFGPEVRSCQEAKEALRRALDE